MKLAVCLQLIDNTDNWKTSFILEAVIHNINFKKKYYILPK